MKHTPATSPPFSMGFHIPNHFTHIRFPSSRIQGFTQLVLLYTNLQETAIDGRQTRLSAISENLDQGMLPLICVLLPITLYKC